MHRAPRPHHRRVSPAGAGAFGISLFLAVGCSQPVPPTQPAAEATVVPPSVERPAAALPDGFEVEVELAITPLEVANGLMYRPSLPEDRGMLFIFEEDRIPSFWMKNTLIPLDMVFLDAAGRVVDVIAEVPPCAADPCPTYSPEGPARAVLELAAGVAAAHGVETGAVLEFDGVPSYPVMIEQPEPTPSM